MLSQLRYVVSCSLPCSYVSRATLWIPRRNIRTCDTVMNFWVPAERLSVPQKHLSKELLVQLQILYHLHTLPSSFYILMTLNIYLEQMFSGVDGFIRHRVQMFLEDSLITNDCSVREKEHDQSCVQETLYLEAIQDCYRVLKKTKPKRCVVLWKPTVHPKIQLTVKI
jgi:hypothetical protein